MTRDHPHHLVDHPVRVARAVGDRRLHDRPGDGAPHHELLGRDLARAIRADWFEWEGLVDREMPARGPTVDADRRHVDEVRTAALRPRHDLRGQLPVDAGIVVPRDAVTMPQRRRVNDGIEALAAREPLVDRLPRRPGAICRYPAPVERDDLVPARRRVARDRVPDEPGRPRDGDPHRLTHHAPKRRRRRA